MGTADLHIHSTYSHDSSSTVSAILEWAASATDLDIIAITDHDRVEGALEAQERAADYGIEVIPGVEVTCSEGHLLALFVSKPIPAHRPALETVLRIGEQGGLCVAAHPLAFLVHGINAAALDGVLRDPDAAKILVGIESINTGLWFPGSNARARDLAERRRLAQTGSSDSHLFWTIGSGYTRFPGYTALDLRRALEQGATEACSLTEKRTAGYYAGHLCHFGMRKLGWATWAPTPHSDLVIRRLSSI